MPTAEPLPDNIRRIAVLVANVDSATASQLLLHLPTSVAKQVRRALQTLGPISPAERQRILTEFQTAAKQQQVATSQPVAAPIAPASANNPSTEPNTRDPYRAPYTYASSLAEHSERGGTPLQSAHMVAGFPAQSTSPDHSEPSWKRMDIRALSHFLRSERASVIAVVINQLSPGTGVALLQQLPPTTHREVLQAIASLQDIDEEAMQSIEDHLAERFKGYEQQANSEAKGTRRVAALLAAAPPELQETWSRFVHIAIDASQDSSTQVPPTTATTATTLQADLSGSAPAAQQVATTNENPTANQQRNATAERRATLNETGPASLLTDSELDDDPYILPFPKPNDELPLSNTDRSLIQLEFEQILTLSTHQLAQVLTATDTQTVLLALAGASPSFMKRFYGLLTKSDGKALASRLSQIGPLKLRDIDEAQRTIAELAAKMLSPYADRHRTSHPQPSRAAA